MAELLIELLSEEIPARMQARAAEDFKRLVCDALKEEGLAWTKAEAYATPRRLALVVDGLPALTPDRIRDEKGPRVGAPQAAIDGFLRKLGGWTLDACEKRSDGKAEYWVFVNRIAGRETVRAAAEIVNDAVRKLSWPKSMRWPGERSGRNLRVTWIRPLRRVLGLFGGEPLKGVIDLDAERGESLPFRRDTLGHRFLSRERIYVSSFSEYREKLQAAHVMIDPAKRRDVIRTKVIEEAAKEGLTLKDDSGLIDEVVGLVEWPVALIGSIDAEFMALPPEVLTSAMRTHQRYFTLLTADGRTAPRFALISNMTDEQGRGAHQHIITGNERVLRARLSDAKFFWDQDRKASLESRLPALAGRTFYARLGTMHDKAERISRLAGMIAASVQDCDEGQAKRAALLAKCDLASGLVGEFPELQGVMGGYLARADREPDAVANAIRDHYRPLGPADAVPSAPVSVSVALADKLDTLVGFFAIGEKPTGSKDPFALRRAALGVIRLIVENRLRISLSGMIRKAVEPYRKAGVVNREDEASRTIRDHLEGHLLPATFDSTRVRLELLSFFADRLKVALREKGVRHDLIDAVFALGGEDDLVRLLDRVEALRIFLKDENGANLLTAYRRAAKIVEIEQKKDKRNYDGPVAEADLEASEELTLNLRLAGVSEDVEKWLREEKFAVAMASLAGLRPYVDAFFDKVTVNDPDPKLRANRLRLLSRIRATLGQVADFGRIEG